MMQYIWVSLFTPSPPFWTIWKNCFKQMLYWLKFLKVFCSCHLSPFSGFSFKMFKPKQKKVLYHLWNGNPPPILKMINWSRKVKIFPSGSFPNKSHKTLHLSHHRLINDDLIFPFYWIWSLGGVRYRVTISVCLSRCLSVPSQNNHLQVSWRLLVEEHVSYIGLWSKQLKKKNDFVVWVGGG